METTKRRQEIGGKGDRLKKGRGNELDGCFLAGWEACFRGITGDDTADYLSCQCPCKVLAFMNWVQSTASAKTGIGGSQNRHKPSEARSRQQIGKCKMIPDTYRKWRLVSHGLSDCRRKMRMFGLSEVEMCSFMVENSAGRMDFQDRFEPAIFGQQPNAVGSLDLRSN